MQVVAGIELRPEVIGICWIAHNLVEIDHRIKVARRPNPLVDHLAVGLSCRSRKIKTRAHERQDRTACHPDAVGASTLDDLLVRAEDVIDQLLVFGWRGLSTSTNIPISLIPSRTIKERTPACAITSSLKRAKALGPRPSSKRRFPPIP